MTRPTLSNYLGHGKPRFWAWIDKLPTESCGHLPAAAGHWCEVCKREFSSALRRGQALAAAAAAGRISWPS